MFLEIHQIKWESGGEGTQFYKAHLWLDFKKELSMHSQYKQMLWDL